MKPNIVGFVFARGGSKEVLRKNIRPLAGKPLVAYAIETGFASRWIDRIVVSTDDAEIAAVARTFGAEVPFMRPAELATDAAPEWKAWQHAVRWFNAAEEGSPLDLFVSIPATAPLRAVEDIDGCIETLLGGDADLAFTVTESPGNPYFDMVTIDRDQKVRLVAGGNARVVRRQDARRVYRITPAAYAARPDFVLRAESMFDGRIQVVEVPRERAVDIDSELDLLFAEFLLRRNTRVDLRDVA